MHTIWRHEVPVDDQWHTLHLTGPVIHVAVRRPHTVDVWVRHETSATPAPRRFRVYGTGQPIEEPTRHVGTALEGNFLVWHLLEAM